MEKAIEKFHKSLIQFNKEIMGFFYYDPQKDQYCYDLSVINVPQQSKSLVVIPFYFNPQTEQGRPVLKIGRAGYTTEQSRGINSIDELITNINNNGDTYLKQIRDKANEPQKFKNSYEFLTHFCYEVEKLSMPLFTELTTFTFPRPLLNTLKAMTLSGYESCGAVSITKLKPKERKMVDKTKPQKLKEYGLMFPYDVSFHSDLPDHCDLSTFGEGGDIHFHTHPVSYINPSEVQLKQYLHDFPMNYHSNPSFTDINMTRIGLSKVDYQVVLIFTYTGLYIFRYQTSVKSPDEVIELSRLDKDIEDEFNNEKWSCKLMPLLQVLTHQDRMNYINLFHQWKDKTITNEDYKSYQNLSMGVLNKMKNMVPFPNDLNNMANIDAWLNKFPKFLTEMNDYCKPLLEKYLNIGNNQRNKITAEFIPVVRDENGQWNYPQFSVKLYPKILGFRGAFATRRLTMRNYGNR